MLSQSHQMSFLPLFIILLVYTTSPSSVMSQDPTTINSISTYPGEKVYPLCFKRQMDRINPDKFEQCCYRYALCNCVKKECATTQYADDYDCQKNWWWQATCTTSYNASCPRIFDDASFKVTCPGLDPDITTYDEWPPHKSNHSMVDSLTDDSRLVAAAGLATSTIIIIVVVIAAILLVPLLVCLYCKYCTPDSGQSHKPKTRSSKRINKKSSAKAAASSSKPKKSSSKAKSVKKQSVRSKPLESTNANYGKLSAKKHSVRSKAVRDEGKFGLLTAAKKGSRSSKKRSSKRSAK